MGLYSVVCGFPPRVVRVYAATASRSLGRASIALMSWQGDGTVNAFAEALSSTSGTGQSFGIYVTTLARVADTATTPAINFNANFSRWNEDGFTVNVTVATAITDVRFVCET